MKNKEKIIIVSIILALTIAITLLLGTNVYATDIIVTFQDQNLKEIMLNNYDTNFDGQMQESEVLNIKYLSANYNYPISNLSGLQYAKNLEEIYIYQAESNLDFTCLKDITTLKRINVTGQINDISTISNLTTLKHLSINSYNYDERGIDLAHLKNLINLETLSLYGNMYNVVQMAGLINLNELSIKSSGMDVDIDLKTFKDMSELRSLRLDGSILNTNYLKELNDLTVLEIGSYMSNNEINFEDIVCLNKLTNLYLEDYHGKLENIEDMTALKQLSISASYIDNYDIDMANLKRATQIESLELDCDMEKIDGIENMTGLKNLILQNRNTYEEYTDQNKVLECINELDLESLKLGGIYTVNIGYICKGEQKTVNLEDVSPFYKATKDSTSVLYDSNIEYEVSSTMGGAQANIDNQNNLLAIKSGNDFGENHVCINSNELNGFTGEIQLVWTSAFEANRINEISIPDTNFKNALLEKYDLDMDGKITAFDMINIQELKLIDKNISNVTGIENAINAEYIDLSCNKITDASPLKNINTNEYMYINLKDNYIDNISNLNGENFYLMNIGYNYIDVSEGSDNLRIIKDSVALITSEDYDKYPDYYTGTKEEAIARNQTEVIDYYRNTKKVGTLSQRNNVPTISEEIKARLISEGVDENSNGIITLGEMSDYGAINQAMFENSVRLDLSGLNISDLSFIRSFCHVNNIDLSNNSISDFSDLERCNSLYKIDLSDNNITNIEGIEKLEEVQTFCFANNEISDLSPIINISNSSYYYLSGAESKYPRYLILDFSNNKISDASAIKQVECLCGINLSNNAITNISCLTDMEFAVLYDRIVFEELDLSNNYISVEDDYIYDVINLFNQKGVALKLDNQQELNYDKDCQYDAETNTVTAIMRCDLGFKETKPTWTLSQDKKTYTKEYTGNGTYTTSFITENGLTITESFEVTEIDNIAPIITITKQYNEQDNTVTVTATSNEILGETKPTWTLREDKMSYSKVYSQNGTYSTIFSDKYGNTISKTFAIDEVETGFTVTKEYDEDLNVVTVVATCNIGFEATKPSWQLSEDKTTYSKVYAVNGTYSTPFVLNDGSVETPTFEVNEIDNIAPTITITKQYNEQDNTVTVTAVSNEIFGETKPSWTLSVDKMSYSKIYATNGTYTTTYQDIYGNETSQTFVVNEIQTGFEVTKQYNPETNKVTVTATCDIGFQATKPSWTLSEDKTTYTKVYVANGTYSTPFILSNGSIETPIFEVAGIDDVAPTITISQEYDEDTGIIKVIATSSKMLKDTKPSWTLSVDKMSYSKEYLQPGTTVTTPFQDTKGNIANVTFVVGAEIQIEYNEQTGKTTVSVVSSIGFEETKPSWTLSEDKTTYTKQYSSNGKYGTPFTFLDGTVSRIEFEINN